MKNKASGSPNETLWYAKSPWMVQKKQMWRGRTWDVSSIVWHGWTLFGYTNPGKEMSSEQEHVESIIWQSDEFNFGGRIWHMKDGKGVERGRISSSVPYGRVFSLKQISLSVISLHPRGNLYPGSVDVFVVPRSRSSQVSERVSQQLKKRENLSRVCGYCSLNNRRSRGKSRIQFISNQRGQIMLIQAEWWLGTEWWMIHWEDDPSKDSFTNDLGRKEKSNELCCLSLSLPPLHHLLQACDLS